MQIVAVVLTLGTLGFAVWRPRRIPEALVALPAAVLAVVIGAVSFHDAWHEIDSVAPTVIFLAALLVIAHGCATLGVFDWIAAIIGERWGRSPTTLYSAAFVVAAAVTAVLSLDATVLLLTPVLLALARDRALSPDPMSYTAVALSNSASTIFPISNLTNLLAYSATGLGFLGYTAKMVLPWLATLAVTFVIYRIVFRSQLRAPIDNPSVPSPERTVPPRGALWLLAAMLLGFGVSSLAGLDPMYVAIVVAVAISVTAIRANRTRLRPVLSALQPSFLLFVLALSVLVAGIADGPLGRWLTNLIPSGTGLPALLAVAAVSALCAAAINNIAATLVMLTVLGAMSAPPVVILAMLIGVNIGPNLTYVGSLANILWRNTVATQGMNTSIVRFTLLGIVSVPTSLAVAVAALWLVR